MDYQKELEELENSQDLLEELRKEEENPRKLIKACVFYQRSEKKQPHILKNNCYLS